MKRLLLTIPLIALCALSVFAQSSANSNHPSPSIAQPSSASAQSDDPVLKALEQATNRLAVAEETNRLLREQLAAKDDRIAAKEAIIEIKDEQIKLLKSANIDRAGANTIDQYRVEACQAQLSKADAEIHRLRYPGFLERLFKPDTIIAGVVGYGFGKIGGK